LYPCWLSAIGLLSILRSLPEEFVLAKMRSCGKRSQGRAAVIAAPATPTVPRINVLREICRLVNSPPLILNLLPNPFLHDFRSEPSSLIIFHDDSHSQSAKPVFIRTGRRKSNNLAVSRCVIPVTSGLATNRQNVLVTYATLRRLRRISQVVFLLAFLLSSLKSGISRNSGASGEDIHLRYPVRLFFELDPLIGISNALASHALYRGCCGVSLS